MVTGRAMLQFWRNPMENDMVAHLKAALANPASVYGSPEDVERDRDLSRGQKLAVLMSWESDARELAVAEEENMAGGEASRLHEVVAARIRVADPIKSNIAANKQGGHSTDPGELKVQQFVRPVTNVIHPDHGVDEATGRLVQQNLPMLPVCDGDEIIGVFTLADVTARRNLPAEPDVITIRQIMRSKLAFCSADDTVAIARAVMSDVQNCQALLVVDEKQRLVGIVSLEDLPPAARLAGGSDENQIEIEIDTRKQETRGTRTGGGLDVYESAPTIKIRVPAVGGSLD